MVSELSLRVANRWAAKARLRPGKHHHELDVGNWSEGSLPPEVRLEVRQFSRSSTPFVYGWIGAPAKPDTATERALLEAAAKLLVPLKWKEGQDWEPHQYLGDRWWVKNVTVDGEFGVGRDRELADAMDKVVKAVIYDEYDSWAGSRKYNPKSKEPQITGSYIRAYLDQAHAPDAFRDSDRKKRDSMVQAALVRLVRKGDVHADSGGEVRWYEPSKAWRAANGVT